MDERNEENLKEMFVAGDEAEQAIEDIRRAERILREHPAPEPSETLINEIKSAMAERLLHRHAYVFRTTAYRAAVAAAAVIILAAVGVRLFEKGGKPGKVVYASIIPTSVWESDDIAADDTDLAILNAEVEQLEGEVLALQSGEGGGNGQGAVTELETELVEIESDFWKG